MDHTTEAPTAGDAGRAVARTVCAIVVTHNRLELLKECVAALRAQERRPERILVVDNGSTDSTGAWLASQGDIEVLTQANLGCAGGFFAGINRAFQDGFDWLWCMDDDCICEPSALAALLQPLAAVPDVPGFVCSRPLNDAGNTINTPDIDMRIAALGILTWDRYLEAGLVKARRASFVSVMFSREAVAACGLPLAEMFIWGEDAEYTSRISGRFECYYSFRSRVLHKRVNQAGRLDMFLETDPARIEMFHYYYRNGLFYRAACYGWKDAVKFFIRCVADAARAGTTGTHRIARLRAICHGCAEYLFFRPQVRFANIAGNKEATQLGPRN